MYRNLNGEEIIATIESLDHRIEESFPNSGLGRVCSELLITSRHTAQRMATFDRPLWWVRAGIVASLTTTFGVFVWAVLHIRATPDVFKFTEFVQVTEGSLNLIVLLGGAIFFVTSAEKRIKRGRALTAIHELRSLAHVVDMHQLLKDPERLLASRATVLLPQLKMTSTQLTSYLSFCADLLSLIGKTSALYVQNFPDPIALNAVNEVESLCTGLSHKIWQKLMILHSIQNTSAQLKVE